MFIAAIHEDCQNAEAYFILGCILRAEKKYALSVSCLSKAVQLKPQSPDYHFELGASLLYLPNFRDAEMQFRTALSLDNTKAQIWRYLATILTTTGRCDEAQMAMDHAIRLAPGVLDSLWYRSVVTLASGDLKRGFEQYEARRKVNPYPKHAEPEWRGEDLTDKTLLIETEQGFGDIIQMARFFSVIAAKQIICGVSAPLKSLLQSSFPHIKFITQNELYQADYYVLSGSLPWKTGLINFDLIPPTPYLKTDKRIAIVRPQHTVKAVGICWYGSTDHENNAVRSSTVETFYRNLTGVGIELYSLQVGVKDPDLALLGEIGLIHDMAAVIHDFADTAAIMHELDCVVTVDTAIAHLAGALGIACHVVIPYHQVDWRWLHNRNDTPWYAAMTLYRQGEFETWDSVLQRIRDALSAS
jgi:hypothetical protein